MHDAASCKARKRPVIDLPFGRSLRWWSYLAMCVSLWLCASCGARGRDPVARDLRLADQIWRQRAQPKGLNDALQSYLDADSAHPEDGRVLWRLARIYTLMGDADPESATRHYSTAKEFGLRCLMLEPSFAGVVSSQGGLVVPEAAKEITEDAKECLTWTVIAWSQWVRARGAAGVGLDLKTVAALGARAADVAGNWGSGRGHYAHALALSLPPAALNPDLDGAEAAFRRAIQAAPERFTPKVDLALYVLQPKGQEADARELLEAVAVASIPASDPELLEDFQAIQRARLALDMAALESPPISGAAVSASD